MGINENIIWLPWHYMHSCEKITAQNSPDYSRPSGQDEWCKKSSNVSLRKAELLSREPLTGQGRAEFRICVRTSSGGTERGRRAPGHACTKMERGLCNSVFGSMKWIPGK